MNKKETYKINEDSVKLLITNFKKTLDGEVSAYEQNEKKFKTFKAQLNKTRKKTILTP